MSNDAPRLVLHIGPHKTGTTYFQEAVFPHRERLAEKGWLYPALGVPGNMGGQHEIGNAPVPFLAHDGARVAELRALRPGRPGGDGPRNLLFSAEGMCHWPVNHFLLMADHLGFETIEVIYALRDPIRLIYSHWSEVIKHGETRGYPEFLAEHYAGYQESRVANPAVNTRDLIEHPRIRVHAIPYEAMMADGLDIVDHILNGVLGIGIDGVEAPASEKSKNASNKAHWTETLRLLNVLVSAAVEEPRDEMRLFFNRKVPAKSRIALSAEVEKVGQRCVTFGDDDPVRERIELIARVRFDGCWTLPVENRTVFRHEPTTQRYHDMASLLLTPGVREQAQEIVDAFAKQAG